MRGHGIPIAPKPKISFNLIHFLRNKCCFYLILYYFAITYRYFKAFAFLLLKFQLDFQYYLLIFYVIFHIDFKREFFKTFISAKR